MASEMMALELPISSRQKPSTMPQALKNWEIGLQALGKQFHK
jgi:hypothetical protein